MLDAHHHPSRRRHYQQDLAALTGADVVVAVLPFGLSAGMELGYAVGAGKHTVVYARQFVRRTSCSRWRTRPRRRTFEEVLAF